MNLSKKSRKEVGIIGENVVVEYLRRREFTLIGRNIARKTGELDVIVRKEGVIHIVEVKALLCYEFPSANKNEDTYNPGENLHAYKIHKVARTAEWYIANIGWEGEWQIDGALVWLRERDGMARVKYLPQIL
jgi:putative endonuclease